MSAFNSLVVLARSSIVFKHLLLIILIISILGLIIIIILIYSIHIVSYISINSTIVLINAGLRICTTISIWVSSIYWSLISRWHASMASSLACWGTSSETRSINGSTTSAKITLILHWVTSTGSKILLASMSLVILLVLSWLSRSPTTILLLLVLIGSSWSLLAVLKMYTFECKLHLLRSQSITNFS